MTEPSPGPGWWRSADGSWHPPERRPDLLAEANRASAPGPPLPGLPREPLAPVPPREPIDWDQVAAQLAARRKANEHHHVRRRAISLLAVTALGLATVAAVARGGSSTDTGEGAGEAATAPITAAAPTSELAAPTTTSASTITIPAGPGSVFSLAVGTCIDDVDLASGIVTEVNPVPCDTAHSHEVYHKASYLPEDQTYDADALAAFAEQQCAAGFEAYVGIPYEKSRFYFLHLAPSAESWTKGMDREVVCLLFPQGDKPTASAQGTAQ